VCRSWFLNLLTCRYVFTIASIYHFHQTPPEKFILLRVHIPASSRVQFFYWTSKTEHWAIARDTWQPWHVTLAFLTRWLILCRCPLQDMLIFSHASASPSDEGARSSRHQTQTQTQTQRFSTNSLILLRMPVFLILIAAVRPSPFPCCRRYAVPHAAKIFYSY
jgi:hypothetical protein